MKYLLQFTLLCIISFISELIAGLLPIPIPSSIYGLLLLLILLHAGIIRLKQIEAVADFLLAIMPVMFVPVTVGLMTKWGVLKDNLVGMIIIIVVSATLVIAVTGLLLQYLLKKGDMVKDGHL